MQQIMSKLPSEIQSHIIKFIPKQNYKKKEAYSPSLQKELYRIQTLKLKGVSNMYMKGFIEFCLE